MEWHKLTTDRFGDDQNTPPPDSGDEDYSIIVLVTDGKFITTGYYEFEYWPEEADEDGLSYSSPSWHIDGDLLSNVTHWMHLPKPPCITLEDRNTFEKVDGGYINKSYQGPEATDWTVKN